MVFLEKELLKEKKHLRSFSVSGTEAELLDSLAKTVDAIYQAFSKGVHHKIEHETALLSIGITEHILGYILEQKEKR